MILTKLKNFGNPKMCRIRRKRVRNHFFNARIGPGLVFFPSDVQKCPNRLNWEAKIPSGLPAAGRTGRWLLDPVTRRPAG
jgi:hypothetical protein